MEKPRLEEYERGCSALTLFRYSAGAGAAEHTDMGLLTIVYARDPGLELRTSAGWQALHCSGALVILAGATLEAATGGSVRAALHRVVPQNTPRCSVVMRVRGAPNAPLPGTVADFEERFRRTHGSINAPRAPDLYINLHAEELLDGAAGSPPDAAVAALCLEDASPAERVLAIPALAALIADAIAAIDDSGVTLARAELVCPALRAAVAPHWAAKCAELCRGAMFRLPRALSRTGDATQWKRLYRIFMRGICLCVKDQEGSLTHVTVTKFIALSRLFDSYCARKRIARHGVRFLFDGCRILDHQTPMDLEMVDGDAIDVMMDQCGD